MKLRTVQVSIELSGTWMSVAAIKATARKAFTRATTIQVNVADATKPKARAARKAAR